MRQNQEGLENQVAENNAEDTVLAELKSSISEGDFSAVVRLDDTQFETFFGNVLDTGTEPPEYRTRESTPERREYYRTQLLSQPSEELHNFTDFKHPYYSLLRLRGASPRQIGAEMQNSTYREWEQHYLNTHNISNERAAELRLFNAQNFGNFLSTVLLQHKYRQK
jgi:hypothetical protein